MDEGQPITKAMAIKGEFIEAIGSEWFRSEIGWNLFLPGILSLTNRIFLFGIPFLRQGWIGRASFVPVIAGLHGGPIPFALVLFCPQLLNCPGGC